MGKARENLGSGTKGTKARNRSERRQILCRDVLQLGPPDDSDIKTMSQPFRRGTDPGSPHLFINGLEEQMIELYHYHEDCWTFLPKTRDECLSQGLETYMPSPRSFTVYFERFSGDKCHAVDWALDSDERVQHTRFTRLCEWV